MEKIDISGRKRTATISPRPRQRNGKAILTTAEVDMIIKEIKQGTSVTKLLKMAGMCRTTLDRVLARDFGLLIETHLVIRGLGFQGETLASGPEMSISRQAALDEIATNEGRPATEEGGA